MPERRMAKDRRQHLYFAFDDWVSGYTIRKVRLSLGSIKGAEQPLSPRSGEGEGTVQPMPGVFMAIEGPRRCGMYFTSAFGAKIVVLHPREPDITAIPILDVKDRRCIFGPEPNYPSCPIYFPVGEDRLFALDTGKFSVCIWTPDRSGPWVWQELTYPPFARYEVSSYAVQPDGCILVSTKIVAAAAGMAAFIRTAGTATFIFDTKAYLWERYGDWTLPFTGRGHYDLSLEAFVGLSKEPETLGYLYSCTLDSTNPYPECKRSKEKVYNENPAERHVSATLVHMRRGKFCLVECVSIDNVRSDQELTEPGAAGGLLQSSRFMYRLKIFSLRYDKNGDLKLKHCRVRYYSLPHETTSQFIRQDPVAFWL
ncbi:unnamed protein product [Urochloa decumbens]|uniref:F-box protein n=1 Tax=Urochloa decumbens TaxID=240449 RepID=A0ABC8XQN3_9POAL